MKIHQTKLIMAKHLENMKEHDRNVLPLQLTKEMKCGAESRVWLIKLWLCIFLFLIVTMTVHFSLLRPLFCRPLLRHALLFYDLGVAVILRYSQHSFHLIQYKVTITILMCFFVCVELNVWDVGQHRQFRCKEDGYALYHWGYPTLVSVCVLRHAGKSTIWTDFCSS